MIYRKNNKSLFTFLSSEAKKKGGRGLLIQKDLHHESPHLSLLHPGTAQKLLGSHGQHLSNVAWETGGKKLQQQLSGEFSNLKTKIYIALHLKAFSHMRDKQGRRRKLHLIGRIFQTAEKKQFFTPTEEVPMSSELSMVYKNLHVCYKKYILCTRITDKLSDYTSLVGFLLYMLRHRPGGCPFFLSGLQVSVQVSRTADSSSKEVFFL